MQIKKLIQVKEASLENRMMLREKKMEKINHIYMWTYLKAMTLQVSQDPPTIAPDIEKLSNHAHRFRSDKMKLTLTVIIIKHNTLLYLFKVGRREINIFITYDAMKTTFLAIIITRRIIDLMIYFKKNARFDNFEIYRRNRYFVYIV